MLGNFNTQYWDEPNQNWDSHAVYTYSKLSEKTPEQIAWSVAYPLFVSFEKVVA